MNTVNKYLQEYKENINDFNKAKDILYELYKYLLEKALNKFNDMTKAYDYTYDNIIKPLNLNLLSYANGYISKAIEEKILDLLITDLKEKIKELI